MHRDLLRLAIPNILSNFSIPLLSSVDVALMGHLSVLHLGAIGLATMIFNFFFWSFGFLRMGTTGMVAQASGAGQSLEVLQLLSRSIILALLISLVILLFQDLIFSMSIMLLGISSDHEGLVYEYFSIRILGAPATLCTYCLIGWLFGKKDTMSPLIATVFINLANILLSYYLVVHSKWGMVGAAYGTVISEYLGIILLLIILRMKYGLKKIERPNMEGLQDFLRINSDLFIRTLLLTLSFVFFYRQSGMQGAVILGANVVLLQFLSWLSYGIDGFAHATEILVGNAKGLKNAPVIRSVIRSSFYMAVFMALFYSVIYYFFATDISGLFSEDNEVIEVLISYRIWLALLPFIAIWCYIWDGVFIGLTRTTIMRNTMLLSFILYIVVYISLEGNVSNPIWYAFMALLFIRGALLGLTFRRKSTILIE